MFSSRQIKAYFIRLLTSKKTTEFDIKNTRNILFLRYDRIGDMVITTPVFRELKLAYPEINISVLASKLNRGVLVNNPYVDKIYTNYKNNLLGDLPTLLKLRRMKFDVCVEFDHSVIPHAIIRLRIIKPKKIISVFNKRGRYGLQGKELELYDYYTEKLKDSHYRDIWLETLSPFGVTPKSKQYDLFCTNSQKKIAKDFINKYTNKFLIGINLEGAVNGKKIEYKELEEICKSLYRLNSNIQVIIITVPNKIQLINKWIEEINLNFVVTSYKTAKILDVAALIQQLDLIITPDTSIVHIASAFNKPIVTIHENNQDSYKLFSPTSDLNMTVFSTSKNSLDGYSIDELICYSHKLMDTIS